VDNIRSATIEELMAVKGITRTVAVAIKEML
jgi:excinuclease UvrABC nuclease subunit